MDGSVNLERGEPDQVVGGFDKGEILYYDGLDFGSTGASKLTVRVANGRADTEEEKGSPSALPIRRGRQRVCRRPNRTDRRDGMRPTIKTFTVEIPSSPLEWRKGMCPIELVEGCGCFPFLSLLKKTENTEPQLLTVQWSGNASMSVEGEAEEIISTDAIYGAKVQPGEELTFTFTPDQGARSPERSSTARTSSLQRTAARTPSRCRARARPCASRSQAWIRASWASYWKRPTRCRRDVIDSLVPSAKEFFENALAKAQEVYEDAAATEEEVKEAWSDLLDAMHLLEFEAGDKETLLPLINIAEQLKDMLDQFKPGTTEGFEEALDAAKDVYAEEDRPEGGRRRGI